MTLDLVIPTYNRQDLLRLTLASCAAANVPAVLEITVIVVDNNSTDSTRQMVTEMIETFPLPLRYLCETKQSSSYARNAGIAAGTGELIGFIDDDEEIEPDWFTVVAREFVDPAVDFIGGPYLPRWVSPVPRWLPPGYHAAIGVIPPKPRSAFAGDFSANLMSGNAVLRRTVFERVGGYSGRLGRSGKGLLAEEDAELLQRIKQAGIPGMYVPDLAIRHYIDPKRLTRKYHRQWAFWRAASQGVLDRDAPEPVRYLLGVPRHRFGRAVRNGFASAGNLLHRRRGEFFSNELAWWDLAGFVYGKFFLKLDSMYAKVETPSAKA